MTREQANRILDLQRTGEANFSRAIIVRALHATGDIASQWSMPRRVVTAEAPPRARARFRGAQA